MQRRIRGFFLFFAIVCVPSVRAQTAELPNIVANDNRVPAGTLAQGVLTLRLNIVRGMWHPDRDSDPGVSVLAFAEDGRAPSIPGPLVRVPAGTVIRTTVRNLLPDSSVLILGLSGNRTRADSARLQPGEARELVARVTASGTMLYRAITSVRRGGQRDGEDGMLAGALVVDDPASSVKDRVFVLLQWIDSVRLKPYPGAVAAVLTINGKTWPHTERLDYDFGDTIRWRVINAPTMCTRCICTARIFTC